MKRAVIVHGWSGTPKVHWYPWLKKELESRNVFVEVPAMPNTETPQIQNWISHLAKFIDKEDDVYLIGHSIGCQTILRYLENPQAKIKGVILAAGWITSLSPEVMSNPQEAAIARPWLETPIDLAKVKTNAGEIISLFSDDDPYVFEDNWAAFEQLGEVIIEHNKGHYEDLKQPSILKATLKLMKI